MAAEAEITINDISKESVHQWINSHAISYAGGQPCVGCGRFTLMVCICMERPHLCPMCQCPKCGQE